MIHPQLGQSIYLRLSVGDDIAHLQGRLGIPLAIGIKQIKRIAMTFYYLLCRYCRC